MAQIDIASALSVIRAPAATGATGSAASSGISFAGALAAASTSAATTPGEVRSGQLAVQLDPTGAPTTVDYFDANGVKLTRSTFSPDRLLELSDSFGIPKSAFSGLADALDAAGAHYKPFELYPGQSDHGIDLRDLAAGGLGTAYDWREDTNVAQKGPQAAQALASVRALAQRLGVTAHANVTVEGPGSSGLRSAPPLGLIQLVAAQQLAAAGAGQTSTGTTTTGQTTTGRTTTTGGSSASGGGETVADAGSAAPVVVADTPEAAAAVETVVSVAEAAVTPAAVEPTVAASATATATAQADVVSATASAPIVVPAATPRAEAAAKADVTDAKAEPVAEPSAAEAFAQAVSALEQGSLASLAARSKAALLELTQYV